VMVGSEGITVAVTCAVPTNRVLPPLPFRTAMFASTLVGMPALILVSAGTIVTDVNVRAAWAEVLRPIINAATRGKVRNEGFMGVFDIAAQLQALKVK